MPTKYETVKVKPKKSSMRNRMSRKSGISRLSDEMFSKGFLEQFFVDGGAVGGGDRVGWDAAGGMMKEENEDKK